MFAGLLSLPFISTINKLFGAAIEIATPVLKFVVESAIQFIKWFWQGCNVIIDNKSTLAVLLVAIAASGWYFRTWNDASVLRDCKHEITTIEQTVPKKFLPKKVNGHYRANKTIIPEIKFPTFNVGG